MVALSISLLGCVCPVCFLSKDDDAVSMGKEEVRPVKRTIKVHLPRERKLGSGFLTTAYEYRHHHYQHHGTRLEEDMEALEGEGEEELLFLAGGSVPSRRLEVSNVNLSQG